MRASSKLLLLSTAVALTAASLFAFDSLRGAAVASGAGPVPGVVGAAGSQQAEPPTAAELDGVRAQITTWLVRNGFMGYRVSEVMAFTNNDYVVVRNSAGRNAFELLTAPAAGWLMLEPPSLVWNTRYGMRTGWQANWAGGGMMPALMGGGRAAGQWDGWYAAGKARVKTASAATAVANRWLGRTRPGERAVGARSFPGYFTLDTTYRGRPAGMISVNAQGAVWYHGWHGGFLAARHYS